jgi:uracil-DNA glycosylase
MDRDQQLREIIKDISVCTKCQLHHSRKLSVPGEGPFDTDIMFIGEAPGFHENEQGRPFVGAAGKLLDTLLSNIGMNRNQVLITNVVKCRPPGNRDPMDEEIEACVSAYLTRQIELIDPKLIITLGRISMGVFFKNAKIGEMHGNAVKIGHRWVTAMYHPAAALHQPKLLEVIQKDFDKLPALVSRVIQDTDQKISEKQTTVNSIDLMPPENNPSQLSLF